MSGQGYERLCQGVWHLFHMNWGNLRGFLELLVKLLCVINNISKSVSLAFLIIVPDFSMTETTVHTYILILTISSWSSIRNHYASLLGPFLFANVFLANFLFFSLYSSCLHNSCSFSPKFSGFLLLFSSLSSKITVWILNHQSHKVERAREREKGGRR